MLSTFGSSQRMKRLWPLPATIASGDVLVTLIRQPASYWRGDLASAYDFNPIVVWALNQSPWLALPGWLAWLGMIALTVCLLPRGWAIRWSIFLSISHYICLAGWLIRWDWRFLLIVIPVGALVLVRCTNQIDRST